MEFKFPHTNGEEIEVPIQPGGIVFVVGANGSGKSALVHRLFIQNRSHARRISAHRQTWFQSNAPDLTASQKLTVAENFVSYDSQSNARWMDHDARRRPSLVIFDLINSENVRARKVAAAFDADDMELALELKNQSAPLTVLNELLRTANLTLEISLENDEQLFAKKDDGAPYSVAELSDGERNAVLITASVITAEPGSLIIIDEPERHLHRSIISPLLLALFEKREDCAFVISTHEVSLPLDSPDSSTLLIRGCTWEGTSASRWDTDLIDGVAPVADDVMHAILGARRKILFIEGVEQSLDNHIYSILFPDLSVRPVGGCTEVIRAVTGIRESAELHWVEAFGLIDRDDRPTEEIDALRDRGVFALDSHSVESLYYCDPVMTKVSERQNQVAEDAADLDAARQAIIDEIAPHRNRLCAKLIARRARAALAGALPTYQSLLEDPVHTTQFDATDLITDEQENFDALVATNDINALVRRYPVREAGALDRAAQQLGFNRRRKYESAVRKLLTEDDEARAIVKASLEPLAASVEALATEQPEVAIAAAP